MTFKPGQDYDFEGVGRVLGLPPSASSGEPFTRGEADSAGISNPSAVAAIVISGDRAVAFRTSDGKLVYADSSVHATILAYAGISLVAGGIGSVITYKKYGIITAGFWTWTPGPVFIDTIGQLTQIPPASPNTLLCVGWAIDATNIDLKPAAPIQRN